MINAVSSSPSGNSPLPPTPATGITTTPTHTTPPVSPTATTPSPAPATGITTTPTHTTPPVSPTATTPSPAPALAASPTPLASHQVHPNAAQTTHVSPSTPPTAPTALAHSNASNSPSAHTTTHPPTEQNLAAVVDPATPHFPPIEHQRNVIDPTDPPRHDMDRAQTVTDSVPSAAGNAQPPILVSSTASTPHKTAFPPTPPTPGSGATSVGGDNPPITPPKKGVGFSPKIAVAALAFVLMLVGGAAGFYLTQQNQDLRQQASTGGNCCSDQGWVGMGRSCGDPGAPTFQDGWSACQARQCGICAQEEQKQCDDACRDVANQNKCIVVNASSNDQRWCGNDCYMRNKDESKALGCNVVDETAPPDNGGGGGGSAPPLPNCATGAYNCSQHNGGENAAACSSHHEGQGCYFNKSNNTCGCDGGGSAAGGTNAPVTTSCSPGSASAKNNSTSESAIVLVNKCFNSFSSVAEYNSETSNGNSCSTGTCNQETVTLAPGEEKSFGNNVPQCGKYQMDVHIVSGTGKGCGASACTGSQNCSTPPPPPPNPEPLTLSGRVYCADNQANYANQTIQLSKFVNGQVTLPEIKTDANGRYSFTATTAENAMAIRLLKPSGGFSPLGTFQTFNSAAIGANSLCKSDNKDPNMFYSYEHCTFPKGATNNLDFVFTACAPTTPPAAKPTASFSAVCTDQNASNGLNYTFTVSNIAGTAPFNQSTIFLSFGKASNHVQEIRDFLGKPTWENDTWYGYILHRFDSWNGSGNLTIDWNNLSTTPGGAKIGGEANAKTVAQLVQKTTELLALPDATFSADKKNKIRTYGVEANLTMANNQNNSIGGARIDLTSTACTAPIGPMCMNITAHTVDASGAPAAAQANLSTLKMNDKIAFKCGGNAAATTAKYIYQFRLLETLLSGKKQVVNNVDLNNAGSATSKPFTINAAKTYFAECRICQPVPTQAGQEARDPICQEWYHTL
jgi:hypothetical protein